MSDLYLNSPFEAYTGDEPYIFISYAHRDGAVVYPEILYLHNLGFRIWYDEGIEPGNEWPEEVARALEGAAYFIVFISPSAVGSRNVRNEINFALNNDKQFLAIYIEQTKLPSGLGLQMGSIQTIFKHTIPYATFERKIEKTLPDILRVKGNDSDLSSNTIPKEKINKDNREKKELSDITSSGQIDNSKDQPIQESPEIIPDDSAKQSPEPDNINLIPTIGKIELLTNSDPQKADSKDPYFGTITLIPDPVKNNPSIGTISICKV